MRITVGRLDLEDTLAQLQDGDVERAAAQVVHGDLLVVLLVQPVGERRGGGLVDDPLDVEAGDAPGILGCLALRIVEVRRDGDDRLGDLLPQVGLRVGPQLLEDHRADLGRRVALAVGQNDADPVRFGILLDLVGHELLAALYFRVIPATPHEALDRVDGIRRVRDGLALRQLADEPLPSLGEGDDRRNGASTFGRGDDGGLPALHHGHDRVRRPEVDADDLAHLCSLLLVADSVLVELVVP